METNDEFESKLKQKLDSLKDKYADDKIRFTNRLSIYLDFDTVVVDSNHDPRREESFLNSTLKGVLQARKMMEELGIEYKRPPDFFAEMIKDEREIQEAKERLEEEQLKIQKAEAKNLQKKVARDVPKDNKQKKVGVLLKPHVSPKQKKRDAKRNKQ